MLGHVTLRTSDVPRATALLNALLGELGHEPQEADPEYTDWGNFGIAPAGLGGRGLTTNVHVGLLAESREAVDRFHAVGVELGCEDDGAPGPRPQYAPDYYGGFLRTFDGWSIEAVHGDTGGNAVHHIALGTADLEAARPLIRALADALGWEVRADVPGNFRIGTDDDARLSLFDGRPPSQNVHFGFLVDSVDDVHRIHEQLLAAGWADDGAPGPRPEYSNGYYGGFLTGPDGNSYEAFTRV